MCIRDRLKTFQATSENMVLRHSRWRLDLSIELLISFVHARQLSQSQLVYIATLPWKLFDDFTESVLNVRNSRVCRRPKFWTLVPYRRYISICTSEYMRVQFRVPCNSNKTELWCSGCGDRFNPCPNCHSPTPAFVTWMCAKHACAEPTPLEKNLKNVL